jgi:hypothetical protein
MRLVIAALPFAALGFISFALLSRMIELVNKKVPENQRVEYAYGYFGKYKKIRALYRKLYPESRLADWEVGVEIAGAMWFVIVAGILFSRF